MELDGRQLRRVLVLWLMQSEGLMTVEELAARLERAGLRVRGRVGKVVSDSLRWEVRRGRVARFRRGTYTAGEIPRTTAWRIRREAMAVLARGRTSAPPPGGSDAVEPVDVVARAALEELVRTRGASIAR